MSPMFNVQTGVPLPQIDRAPKGGRRKYPLEAMKVGDMFFVPGKSTRPISAYISRETRDLPGKFSARHCWMVKQGDKWVTATKDEAGAVEGTGVWRIE